MISKTISMHIVKYLLEEKGYSKKELSTLMDISVKEINKTLHLHFCLEPHHINNFVNNTDFYHWQLMDEAVPSHFLSEKLKRKIKLCRKLTERLKKQRK